MEQVFQEATKHYLDMVRVALPMNRVLPFFFVFTFYIDLKNVWSHSYRINGDDVYIYIVDFIYFWPLFSFMVIRKTFLPLCHAGTLGCDVVYFPHSITHSSTIFYYRSLWVCTWCSPFIPLGNLWAGIFRMANTILAVLYNAWLLGPLELGISLVMPCLCNCNSTYFTEPFYKGIFLFIWTQTELINVTLQL